MKRLLAIFAFALIAFCQNPNTAVFPSAVATDTDLPVASNRFRSTLAIGINASTLSISVADASTLTVPAIITIGACTTAVNCEHVLICSKVGNALTACASGRGFSGSSAAAFSAGVPVAGTLTTHGINQLNAEVKAIETSLVGTYNVKSYGAIGNGTADDTTAIQAALVAGAGKVVYFPPGNYKVSSTLTPAASTTVEGTGQTLADVGSAYSTKIAYTSATTPLFSVAASNITIRGFMLQMSAPALGTWTRAGATLTNIVVATNVATATTLAAHGLITGQKVVVRGATVDPDLLGTYSVTGTPTPTTFTFTTVDVADATYTDTSLVVSQYAFAATGNTAIKVIGTSGAPLYTSLAASGRISNVRVQSFYYGLDIDGTGGLFTMDNVMVNNSVDHGIVARAAQGFWSNIDCESNVGSGIYITSSALGSGVSPWITVTHSFANGRYGIEIAIGALPMLSGYYPSSNSLGDIYTNSASTDLGAISNSFFEWTGDNPWAIPVYITAATNANPIEITTSTAHGFVTGQTVDVWRVLGNTAANGSRKITYVSPTQFTIDSSVGNAAYAPTTGCITTPDAIGCARAASAKATYRSLPTASAIRLDSSAGPYRIDNVQIYAPTGNAIESSASHTSVRNSRINGGGNGGVLTSPYAIKLTGGTSNISGVYSNTPAYLANATDTQVIENYFVATAAAPALEVASGLRVQVDQNGLYSGGAAEALKIASGVTLVRGTNNVNGNTTDASTTNAFSGQTIGIKTTFAALSGDQGWCTDCQPTSASDNTCAGGGTGARYFFDSTDPTWRCYKTTLSQGPDGVVTVRNSAGTGTCTITFTKGLYASTTCP